MLVTVFTPVYNRAYIITRLYESLCRQTCKDFEWVVVDDGSTDNIDELMHKFIEEKKIEIRYFKQPNGGKHRAINHGAQEAYGEMFFIVDSDDYLTSDAIEFINENSDPIINDGRFAGISGIRIRPDMSPIAYGFKDSEIISTYIGLRFIYGIKGDLAEIYKTSVLREFCFPEIETEKFCPEALVWYRIAKSGYKIKFYNKGLYMCEYLPDGLTANMVKVRRQAPLTMMIHYSERATMPIPLKDRFRAVINFWRFARIQKIIDKRINISYFLVIWTPLLFPLSLWIRFNDNIHLKSN